MNILHIASSTNGSKSPSSLSSQRPRLSSKRRLLLPSSTIRKRNQTSTNNNRSSSITTVQLPTITIQMTLILLQAAFLATSSSSSSSSVMVHALIPLPLPSLSILLLLSHHHRTTTCMLFSVVSSSEEPPSASSSSSVAATATTESSSTSLVSKQPPQPRRRRFMYMTPEQDAALKAEGDTEEGLMQTPTPLLSFTGSKKIERKGKGFGGGGGGSGFGGAKPIKGNKGKKQATADVQQTQKADTTTTTTTTTHDPLLIQSILQEIQNNGLVRLDNVLSAPAADTLRDYLLDLRQRSTVAIEDGTISDSQERFADVLLNQNRCDLKVPLGPPPVHQALLDVLADKHKQQAEDESTIVNTYTPSLARTVIEGVFDAYSQGTAKRGNYASLWELNCFMSNSGARRQLVHADNVCLEPVPGLQGDGKEPILLTCFIALQDIDATMGPTVWMPGTHTIEAHNRFFETGRDGASTKTESYSPKNDILQSSKAVIGAPLPKGSCVIFDPRVLHCAGANHCDDPSKTRALFYMSFKNPKIDSPGCPSTSGYGISTAELTMEQLVNDLINEQQGQPARYISLIASNP